MISGNKLNELNILNKSETQNVNKYETDVYARKYMLVLVEIVLLIFFPVSNHFNLVVLVQCGNTRILGGRILQCNNYQKMKFLNKIVIKHQFS